MNARARNSQVEATLNHPFAAQVLVAKALKFVLGPVLRPAAKALRVGKWTLRSPSEVANGLVHVATHKALRRVSGERFSVDAGPLSAKAGCVKAPADCGRLEQGPNARAEFKADAAKLFDRTYDALLPYLEAPP